MPHAVPDFAIITEYLTDRLGNEASQRFKMHKVNGEDVKFRIPGPFRAVIEAEGGQRLEFGTGPALMMEQRMLAEDLVTALNKHLHHDGCWMFSFCDPAPKSKIQIGSGREYGRFVILWMDRDGDIQFPIECSRPFHVYLTEGPNALIEKCEKAYQQWFLYMRTILDPQPDELYKRALGEAPKVLH